MNTWDICTVPRCPSLSLSLSHSLFVSLSSLSFFLCRFCQLSIHSSVETPLSLSLSLSLGFHFLGFLILDSHYRYHLPLDSSPKPLTCPGFGSHTRRRIFLRNSIRSGSSRMRNPNIQTLIPQLSLIIALNFCLSNRWLH